MLRGKIDVAGNHVFVDKSVTLFENVKYTRFGKLYCINEIREWKLSPDSKIDYATEEQKYLSKVITENFGKIFK